MKKVLVAMSGGVDSSVAAALLKKEGFSVIGVFMHFWSDPSGVKGSSSNDNFSTSLEVNKCCSIEAQEQARRVAQKIGIPLYTVNYKDQFKKIVVDYYIREYQAGRTPNPCVVCNQFIKFGLLLNEAKKQGCDFLATGHYAQIKNGELLVSPDKNKDQTYFLHRLDKNKLKKILFPVGIYEKSKVRQIAKKLDLPTASRKDSQGICFIASTNEQFLKKNLKVKPGPIIDIDGIKVGEHDGLLYYTVGQRHGWGNLNLKKSILGKNKSNIPPLYVVLIDVKSNTLVVGREEDVYSKELIVKDVSWILGSEPKDRNIGARIRYRHPINKCKIKLIKGNQYKVTFQKSQRAITPGQSVVFYSSGKALGGGIIV